MSQIIRMKQSVVVQNTLMGPIGKSFVKHIIIKAMQVQTAYLFNPLVMDFSNIVPPGTIT